MSNLVLPVLPGMTFPVKKIPMWKTDITEAVSGKENRVSFWSYPRWRYELGFELLRDYSTGAFVGGELQELLGFFNRHQGAYDTWLFSDPDDNSVAEQAFGTGNAVITQFQLVRERGGFIEPVKDLNGNPTIKVAGVTKTLTTDYTISSTGLVTFVAAPSGALTWSGQFYWRCRFTEDEVEASKWSYQLWEMQSLEFVSVK